MAEKMVQREWVRKVLVAPSRLQAIEQEPFGGAPRINDDSLHLAHVSTAQFIESLLPFLCCVVGKRFVIWKRNVLGSWMVFSGCLRTPDLRVTSNSFIPEFESQVFVIIRRKLPKERLACQQVFLRSLGEFLRIGFSQRRQQKVTKVCKLL